MPPFKAECVHANPDAAGIQDPQTDLFTKQHRQRMDPEIDRPGFGDLYLDVTVLRDATFGDIDPGHHL